MRRNGNDRKIDAPLLVDVSNKRILLVEDMIETGRALTEGKRFLEGRGALVQTACLYTMPQSEIVPDYSLSRVDKVTDFPWNK